MNKLSEIQKLLKGCGKEFRWIEYLKDKRICAQTEDLKHSWYILYCPTCQAKLQTWKQALIYQLKELDEDIEWLEKINFGDGNPNFNYSNYIKQKLAEKQSNKSEINKLLREAE